LAFTSKLMPPSAMSEFWRDIPGPLTFIENLFRVLVFGLPFAMPLRLATTAERRALLVFVFGTLAYFASWLALMYWPHSARSTSVKRTKVETVVWVKLRISRIRLVSPEILFS